MPNKDSKEEPANDGDKCMVNKATLQRVQAESSAFLVKMFDLLHRLDANDAAIVNIQLSAEKEENLTTSDNTTFFATLPLLMSGRGVNLQEKKQLFIDNCTLLVALACETADDWHYVNIIVQDSEPRAVRYKFARAWYLGCDKKEQ